MKDQLIYVYPRDSTFVQKDKELLSQVFLVKSPPTGWHSTTKIPWLFLQHVAFFFKNARKSKAIIVMFGGYWSIIPAICSHLTGVKTYIILGGADSTSFPLIKYGNLRKWHLKALIGFSIRHCSGLLPVHESLIKSTQQYSNFGPQKQGIANHFPSIKQKFIPLYNTFDGAFWNADLQNKKVKTFITVAGISTHTRFVLKGIDLIIEMAKTFPDSNFIVVGVSEDFSREISVPDNVTVYHNAPRTKVRELLQTSMYFLQLSVSEGFPNAICEGMLCGCIPIGSKVGAIPDIIEDCGFLVEHRDLDLIENTIRRALNLSNGKRLELSQKSRTQILDKFPLKKRLGILEKIVASSNVEWIRF